MQHETVPRENVLSGVNASSWLADRGMTGSGPSHLIADEIAVPRFRAARVWHSSAVIERAPTEDALFVFVVADGSAEVMCGTDATAIIASGDLVVVPEDRVLTLTVADRLARFEFEIEIGELALSSEVVEVLREGSVVRDAAPSFRPVLLAAMNAACNAGLGPDSAGFSAFRLAATSLLSGLLDEATARRAPGRSTREAILHRRALDAIALRAADPAFSAAALARALNISERHLRRVFERCGETPAAALRDARLARAQALLSAPSPLPLAEAARSAGFRSPRALRRATALAEESA